jgi:membrane-associated protein
VLVVAAFLLGFAESAFGLDLIIPGELGMAVSGAAAAHNQVPFPLMAVVAVLGCIAGDSAGYWLGRRFGTDVVCRWRFTRRRLGRGLARADDYFDRHGGLAVFAGRWIGALRAVVPVVAGAAKMPFGRFLLWDIPAIISWAVSVVAVGYFLGEPVAEQIDEYGKFISAGGVLLIAGYLFWRFKIKDDSGKEKRRNACDECADEERPTAAAH